MKRGAQRTVPDSGVMSGAVALHQVRKRTEKIIWPDGTPIRVGHSHGRGAMAWALAGRPAASGGQDETCHHWAAPGRSQVRVRPIYFFGARLRRVKSGSLSRRCMHRRPLSGTVGGRARCARVTRTGIHPPCQHHCYCVSGSFSVSMSASLRECSPSHNRELIWRGGVASIHPPGPDEGDGHGTR